jgi:hypothetical protein
MTKSPAPTDHPSPCPSIPCPFYLEFDQLEMRGLLFLSILHANAKLCILFILVAASKHCSSSADGNQTTTALAFTTSSSPTILPTPTPAIREQVENCLQRLVLRVRTLNGPFFTQDQGIQVGILRLHLPTEFWIHV